jgi:hypothetical protein
MGYNNPPPMFQSLGCCLCIHRSALVLRTVQKKQKKNRGFRVFVAFMFEKIAFYACHSFVIYEQICFANKDKSYFPMEKN